MKVEVSVSGNKTEFVFDQFFGEACSQADLFESCGRPVADEVLDGIYDYIIVKVMSAGF